LIGGFLGKLPLYGALTLFIAPLVLVPFILVFQVALVGQLLMYAVLFGMVFTTIWLSNFLSAAIQAKLGDSPRGDDLAKGLGFLLAIATIIPMYGLMFFAPQLSAILGLNVFLVLPFTWPADLVSWSAILFNGIGLSTAQIQVLRGTLQLDLITTGALMGVFTLSSAVLALLTADRVFAYRLGARTERVTTVGRDNLVLRGIRRVSPGSFGTLVVASFKDLFRKAQNLSKIAYGMVLAVALPFILSAFAALEDKLEAAAYALSPEMLIFVGGMSMTIIGSITFVGTSFIESKDQLWIIQSAPKGVVRYVKARLACAFLAAIPLTILPMTLTSIITGASLALYVVMLVYGYVVQCSAIMFSTGVTTMNPNYENIKSPQHRMNLIVAMMVPQVAMMTPILVSIFGDIFNVSILGTVMLPVRILGPMLGFAIITAIPLVLLGGFTVLVGAKRLSRPDT
jgi:hypothetical protein